MNREHNILVKVIKGINVKQYEILKKELREYINTKYDYSLLPAYEKEGYIYFYLKIIIANDNLSTLKKELVYNIEYIIETK